jgi:ribosome biogenesis protein BRX1
MSSKRKRSEAKKLEVAPPAPEVDDEEEEVEAQSRFYGAEGDSDDSDEEIEREVEVPQNSSSYGNRQRVLLLSSRGITARYRHLLEDMKKLIPHHKKDSKLDCKGDIQVVNEIAEMKSCNQVVYLDTRKHQDLYMYLGHSPHGPTAKFHVVNVHTMDELKLTGNCMLGSRPILNFDLKFESAPHWKLLKGLLTDVFNTPKGHPKSKPFIDHVMSFFIVKSNIWVRNYQIVEKSEKKADGSSTNLVEIGPRMVLIPIRIFNGSLGGATLYQNPAYVSPNEERSMQKRRKG